MKYKYPKYLEKGMKFNRLTVMEVDESSKLKDGKKVNPSKWKYKCKCECERITSVRKDCLTTGQIKSCTCSYRKRNKVKICEDHVKIFFNKSDKFTIIDKIDYDKVKNYTWSYVNGYAVALQYLSKNIRLHRLITDCPKGLEVDHINHDTLDNRKENLRIVTSSQNAMNKRLMRNNTSGVTGVSWHKAAGKWEVHLKIGNKPKYFGLYINKEDAIKARREAEMKYFGEYRYQE